MKHKISFWHSIIWTTEGHLDLTWLISIALLAGMLGAVVCEALGGHISIAAYSCLGTSFFSALVAAIPISKARILAQSKASDVAEGMSKAISDVGQGVDVAKRAIDDIKAINSKPETRNSDAGKPK